MKNFKETDTVCGPYIIDTYIRVFVHAFVIVSVDYTYILIFGCTFVQVLVIDTLHIDFVWRILQYF